VQPWLAIKTQPHPFLLFLAYAYTKYLYHLIRSPAIGDVACISRVLQLGRSTKSSYHLGIPSGLLDLV